MSRRTGSAYLPLHGGRVPQWLATRMASMSRIVTEALVVEYGRDELLRRLANPFWFQSFGAVMGMDWHSSGMTTSVLSALRRGLDPIAHELGLYICGGRGRASRATPSQLLEVGEQTGLDGDRLARTSRLVASVDSSALQDGYQLYLHGFIVTADGKWTVIQQGMNDDTGLARRYHWLSEGLRSFVEEPHSALEGPSENRIFNLTDRRAGGSRDAQLALVRDGADRFVREFELIRADEPVLSMPQHHDVRPSDVRLPRLHAAIAAAERAAPHDFADLLLVPGVGPRTVEAIALVAEVMFGAPSRFDDPARFAVAHGGKDGHPFPVPLDVFDHTLGVLKSAVSQAKLGNGERMAALKRLNTQAQLLEAGAKGGSWDTILRTQRKNVRGMGGRSVGNSGSQAGNHLQSSEAPSKLHKARQKPRSTRQLALF